MNSIECNLSFILFYFYYLPKFFTSQLFHHNIIKLVFVFYDLFLLLFIYVRAATSHNDLIEIYITFFTSQIKVLTFFIITVSTLFQEFHNVLINFEFTHVVDKNLNLNSN